MLKNKKSEIEFIMGPCTVIEKKKKKMFGDITYKITDSCRDNMSSLNNSREHWECYKKSEEYVREQKNTPESKDNKFQRPSTRIQKYFVNKSDASLPAEPVLPIWNGLPKDFLGKKVHYGDRCRNRSIKHGKRTDFGYRFFNANQWLRRNPVKKVDILGFKVKEDREEWTPIPMGRSAAIRALVKEKQLRAKRKKTTSILKSPSKSFSSMHFSSPKSFSKRVFSQSGGFRKTNKKSKKNK